jgi:glutamyl-tRNA reductase
MQYSSYLAYCGFHIKSCPLTIREALSKLEDLALVKKLFFLESCPVKEVELVIIATCNRFDICFLGQISHHEIIKGFYNLICYVTEETLASDFSFEEVEKFLRLTFDEEALRLLFRVSSSLDSMIIGETQIFSQIKLAFQKALEANLCSKRAYEIFSPCFKTVKRIRHETLIGQRPVSVGHAAVELAFEHFGQLDQLKILILGAGEMAKITAQYLSSLKATPPLTIASRTFENAKKLSATLKHASALPLQDVLRVLPSFDICFCALSGQEVLITPKELKNLEKDMMIIDMSMPRKVSSLLKGQPHIFIYDMKDLNKITHSSLELRLEEAKKAEVIIEEEIQKFLKLQKEKERLKTVGQFHAWVYEIVEKEVSRALNNKDKDQQSSKAAKAACKKLVSTLAQRVREEGFEKTSEYEALKHFNTLFPFEPEENVSNLIRLDYKKQAKDELLKDIPQCLSLND